MTKWPEDMRFERNERLYVEDHMDHKEYRGVVVAYGKGAWSHKARIYFPYTKPRPLIAWYREDDALISRLRWRISATEQKKIETDIKQVLDNQSQDQKQQQKQTDKQKEIVTEKEKQTQKNKQKVIEKEKEKQKEKEKKKENEKENQKETETQKLSKKQKEILAYRENKKKLRNEHKLEFDRLTSREDEINAKLNASIVGAQSQMKLEKCAACGENMALQTSYHACVECQVKLHSPYVCSLKEKGTLAVEGTYYCPEHRQLGIGTFIDTHKQTRSYTYVS